MMLKSLEGREITPGFHHPSNSWKTLCQPSSKGVSFSNQGKDKADKKGGMGSAFHQLCSRYSGSLTPTAPMANKLWETYLLPSNFQLPARS